MIATVTYPYRDRETYEIHRTGDEVELTPERFAELSACVLSTPRRQNRRYDFDTFSVLRADRLSYF